MMEKIALRFKTRHSLAMIEKHALILVAHGSRHDVSNQEVLALVPRLIQQMDSFDLVVAGFLELAVPRLEDCLALCLEQKITHIRVLPYFLAAGRHVTEDLPERLQLFKRKNPHIVTTLAPHIGLHSSLVSLIVEDAVAHAVATSTSS